MKKKRNPAIENQGNLSVNLSNADNKELPCSYNKNSSRYHLETIIIDNA